MLYEIGHTVKINKVEQSDAVNPHAFGTSVTIPADAGSRARSMWGYLIADVR